LINGVAQLLAGLADLLGVQAHVEGGADGGNSPQTRTHIGGKKRREQRCAGKSDAQRAHPPARAAHHEQHNGAEQQDEHQPIARTEWP
jgi:hypothetical protein